MLIIDQTGTQIGPITEFHNFNGNTCITVNYHDRDIMLPINDNLIIDVTEDAIILTIPEGLLN